MRVRQSLELRTSNGSTGLVRESEDLRFGWPDVWEIPPLEGMQRLRINATKQSENSVPRYMDSPSTNDP